MTRDELGVQRVVRYRIVVGAGSEQRMADGRVTRDLPVTVEGEGLSGVTVTVTGMGSVRASVNKGQDPGGT